MNKILCACCIYPAVSGNVDNLFSEIEKQTNKDFDILIIEDGLLYNNQIKGLKTSIKTIRAHGETPIEIRELIIEYSIKMGYEKLIFFDSDDSFLDTRVEKLSEALDKYSLVVHDLTLVDSNKNVIQEQFIGKCIGKSVFGFEDLLDKNFSGLSNSGYRVDSLTSIKKVGSGIVAFDWWIALNILCEHNGFFIKEALTNYTRNELNSVEIGLSDTAVTKEYKEKTEIYSKLIEKAKLSDVQIKMIEHAKTSLEYSYRNNVYKSAPNVWWNLLSQEER